MTTCKELEAKRKQLAAIEFDVKDKRCFMLDPSNTVVRLKRYSVVHHLSHDTIEKALEGFRQLEDIAT